jgi:hypothetical protein
MIVVGIGEQVVYAGGWKANNIIHYEYENDNVFVFNNNVISRLVDKIFESKLYGFTFWVHNLGELDALYLINSISSSLKYSVKGQIKRLRKEFSLKIL